MRRAHKMCTHIAEGRRELQAIDQKPPDWTAGKKKRTLNRSSKQREATRKGQISELLGLVDNAIELRNQASIPSPAAARFSTFARPLGFCRQPTFPESALLGLTSAARWSLTRTIVRQSHFPPNKRE